MIFAKGPESEVSLLAMNLQFTQENIMNNQKKTYLLVHGAWEGAWSWKETTKYLEKSGSDVISIDLPGHGNDKTPIEVISLRLYADRVRTELERIGKPVVLIAHSFGGFVISQVAEDVPEKIEKMIFVASVIPHEGKNMPDIFEEDAGSELMANLIFSEDKTWVTLSEKTIMDIVFTGASEEQMADVFPNLVNQAAKPLFETVQTTAENFGSVPKAYVETVQDRVISLEAQRRVRNAVGIKQAITLDTGHVPLVTTPEELANALIKLSTEEAAATA